MSSLLNDTIVALATPVGTSAIAVIRVSGPTSSQLAREIFGQTPPPRAARHGDYRQRDGALVDDVLYTFFQKPHSFTGEDSLEISCHGNPFIAQKILEDLLARGGRSAEPGEFTKRAFLHGKMDLGQAEAVMDLIHARSERALAAANQQLRGSLARKMAELVDGVVGVLARIEAYIDFPEEDLPPEENELVAKELTRLGVETDRLLATSHYGEMLRHGIKTVIIGAPNVGKSSLLNRLVGRDRAIVSPEPGTTRDFIEDRILVGGHWLRIIDTAGINATPAPLEKLGIEKSLENAADADLLLVVLDATEELPASLDHISSNLLLNNVLMVLNKIDLVDTSWTPRVFLGKPLIPVSALSGLGWEELLKAIGDKAESFRSETGSDTIAISARHAHALGSAKECLREAAAKLASGAPTELLASDLRGVLDAYGEISGKVDNEQMLDRLFATFCIGK